MFIAAFTPPSPSKPGFVHGEEGSYENPLRSVSGTGEEKGGCRWHALDDEGSCEAEEGAEDLLACFRGTKDMINFISGGNHSGDQESELNSASIYRS